MRAALTILLVSTFAVPAFSVEERERLDREFEGVVKPFVQTYCTECHSGKKPKAKFDLSPYRTLDSVASDFGHWDIVLERLRAEEMPPEEADTFPDAKLRKRVIGWLERLRRHEADRNAGDPGPVLARRLSNAEYNYSIHDLTGVDIRPTREFPVDPANKAGFDNSGESLSMSPALLKKYYTAARQVADHLLLLPDGLGFAPHPVVIYSDRDKYCVHRIVDFYRRQPTDYAGYLFAAWRHRHRKDLGNAGGALADLAREAGISPKYLDSVWAILTGSDCHAGPVAELRERWNALPPPGEGGTTEAAEAGCAELRNWLIARRKAFIPDPGNFRIKGLHQSTQPVILWKNREIAARRRLGNLSESGDAPEPDKQPEAVARFCDIFPDAFYVSERGRMFLPPKNRNKGRLLSAGFHMMLGYYRDDAPLYDLVLNTEQRAEQDRMWRELDFITDAPARQLGDFVYLERAESPGFLNAKEFEFAREAADITSPAKMERLARLYLAKVRSVNIEERAVREIDAYFRSMSQTLRGLEQARAKAEPVQWEALLDLVQRAWQRPLTRADREALLGFYRNLRDADGLGHEDALRDTLVSVLMSPRFCFRYTAAGPGAKAGALTGHELASRLSYFLWSSLPDAELLEQAQAGTLHQPEILVEQTRRMLRDPRIRRLATEFGGNWLDIRRFESHQGVNRGRFPAFTDALRQSMFEEPIRFFTDLAQRNGSVLDFLEARHTFVNAGLAAHYGLPFSHADPGQWIRVDDARGMARGGLLPMSVFLTANSPGLRTSPVKRGYWVVRRLLGERIPAPPPEVPDLPEDESKLGELSLRDLLARHREHESCAGCHRRFDSIGLVFEGYGPVGETRKQDLGGRPVDASAVFPDGSTGTGVDGLRRYLRNARQDDFIDTLGRKLLAYALGRSLLLSDESAIILMKDRLRESGHGFHTMVEVIVTRPQFLQKRGRDFSAAKNAGVKEP